MEIKEAESVSDAKYIAEIYRSEVGNSPETNERDTDRVFKSVSKELEEIQENRVVFLGFDQNKPIATIQLILKRADNDPELADGQNIAHIHHLRVATNSQKKGLGKTMMEHAEEYAKEHGFKKLTLGVDGWNDNAIGFYQHLGWQPLKEVEGKNPGDKLIYMQKDII